MKRNHALIVAAALALGAVHARADNPLDRQGFNELDTDNDSKLTRSEAAKQPEVAKRFDQADDNHDGKLTREEYLESMTKKDLNTLREKAAELLSPEDKDKPAASGK